MQVIAFSTPSHPEWYWRIVNYAGEVIEESRDLFPSIATALAKGRLRLAEMDVADRSTPRWPYRSTSHLRSR